ncbi:fucolectin-like [Astyanax mexicanus]|uniref:fucolectin-like n=1 Tax=Astyanax mexicanus TaxID=7994 RepID=UPI0020CB3147|nr:fucolectin-like [Astyanax mexicanus]
MTLSFECLLLLSGLLCFFSTVSPDVINKQEDLALRGNATQSSSSDFPQFHAALANDGITNTNIYALSCSTTDRENQPWWRVDLLDVFNIGKVIVTNRGDCCPERLNGTEIRIGNSLQNNGNNNPRCAVINSTVPAVSYNFTCNMTGRYVNLVIPADGAVLTLCEVEVYKAPELIKKGNLRMKMYSSENLGDSTVTDKVLQQIKSAALRAAPPTELHWTRNPEKLRTKGTVSLYRDSMLMQVAVTSPVVTLEDDEEAEEEEEEDDDEKR